jgi:hypothetical protein
MISGIQYKNEYIGVNIGQAYDLSNLEHTMQAILVELKPQFPCFQWNGMLQYTLLPSSDAHSEESI